MLVQKRLFSKIDLLAREEEMVYIFCRLVQSRLNIRMKVSVPS